MIERLIEWSARNPFLIALATIALTFGGIVAILRTPLDALPDLSDVQVIIYTEFPGQAPQVVEDQVTYPLTTAMLSVPHSKVVRGYSFFGASFVYIIFDDGTDIYWARSRVLEYLNAASERLPPGVSPQLGPDATGVGWVYQYVLKAKNRTLAELRTLQDWFLRYQLTKAHGVSEVASIGGYVQQYQVVVDPARLRAYGIPLAKVSQVVRDSNRTSAGAWWRWPRPSTWCADTATCVASRTSRTWCCAPRAARPCACATWRAWSWGPMSAAASPN